MAWQWRKTDAPNDAVNLAPSTGTELMYTFKLAWKTANHTVPASSDATTMYSSDGITGFGTGAGGLGNPNAWMRLRMLSGREFVIQRNNDTAWRIVYSASAGFTTGGTATTIPTATDQQYILGTSGSFGTLLPANGTYKAHIGFDNAAPYSFFFVAMPNGGTGYPSMFYGDGLLPNTYPSADADPWLTGTNYGSPMNSTYLGGSYGTYGPWAYYKKGMAGEAFNRCGASALFIGSSQIMPGMGSNPYGTGDDFVPVIWARVTTSSGWKGMSAIFLWGSATHANGEYDDLSNPSARRYFLSDLSVPFPTSVLPQV